MAYERRCTTPPNNGGRYQPGRWPPASEHPCASGPPASQDRREHSRQTADRLDDETGLTLTDWTHSNASARCPTPLHTSGRRFDPCRATTVIAGQLRFAGLTTGTADPRWAKNGPTGFAPPVWGVGVGSRRYTSCKRNGGLHIYLREALRPVRGLRLFRKPRSHAHRTSVQFTSYPATTRMHRSRSNVLHSARKSA